MIVKVFIYKKFKFRNMNKIRKHKKMINYKMLLIK